MIFSETFAKPLQSNYSPAPRQSLHLVQGRPMVIAATLSAI